MVALALGFVLTPVVSLSYTLRPEARPDGTILKVELRIKAVQPMTLELPKDYYNTPDLPKAVVSMEGVKPSAKPNERIVEPDGNGEATIRYTLNYPSTARESSFGPSISPDRFQAYGCQWMLRVGDLKEQRPIEIHVRDVPKGWHLYSSLSPNAQDLSLKASYNDLIPSVIGAGKMHRRRFDVKGKPVDIFLDPRLHVKAERTLDAVEKVVRLQRDWFQDYGQPYFMVSISKRDDNIAGARGPGAFVCFVKDDVVEAPLLNLLAHEMMHNWVPNQMHVEDGNEDERWMWEWFDEGFDEYYARRVMLESKSIIRRQYIDLFNQDLLNIAENPVRASTYEQVKKDMDDGRLSVAHKKLSYYRGALIAANWDKRSKGRGDELIRRLRSVAKDGMLTPEEFYREVAKFGIDAKKDQDKYIALGEPIALEHGLFDADLVEVEFPRFDAGYDTGETIRTRKIARVDTAGAAFAAGLRDGMDYIRTENGTRFGNAWDPNKPFVVVVRDGEAEKRISFHPFKGTQKVVQFKMKDR